MAAELYNESALQEHVPAMVALAMLLFRCAKNGTELEYNQKQLKDKQSLFFEAAEWLRLVATIESNAQALFMLGLFYEQGLSVDCNHEIAFKYYMQAS